MSEQQAAESEFGPYSPYVSRRTGPGSGADWLGEFPDASLRRIRASASVEEAGVQATTEMVILLHSIRRILMWMLVIVPVVSLVLLIGLIALGSAG